MGRLSIVSSDSRELPAERGEEEGQEEKAVGGRFLGDHTDVRANIQHGV